MIDTICKQCLRMKLKGWCIYRENGNVDKCPTIRDHFEMIEQLKKQKQ